MVTRATAHQASTLMSPTALFDMVSDPYQTRNITDESPEILKQCREYLARWLGEQQEKGLAEPDPVLEVLRERKQD